MKITISSIKPWRSAEDISSYAQGFITPHSIRTEDVSDIAHIETSMFDSGVTTFRCQDKVYLLFHDDAKLTMEQVLSRLQSSTSIEDPAGELCAAADNTEDKFGVSIDHDPFHDGYSYLWLCKKAEQVTL